MTISANEARAIAKEATTYGFPLVDNYRIQYSYFVDRNNPEFKSPWNQIHSIPRAYSPSDKTVQAPNSDTPCSTLGADLRAEPLVLTVPLIEPSRYFALQFIDSYTFNFAYIGTRTTGNVGGHYLLAGPGWKGERPSNISRVIHAETQFVFVLYRTQLFKPQDLDGVKKVQAAYRVQPLSAFLGQSVPPSAPEIEFIRPLRPTEERSSLLFFQILNFVLQFCPTHPSEVELMKRFRILGIGGDQEFNPRTFPSEIRNAVEEGMADAWKEFGEFKTKELDTGKRESFSLFGSREYLKNNYLLRMAGAVLEIYGNSKEETISSTYFVDSIGQKLDASKNFYALRFGPGQLPPVNAFWSLTMYELSSSLLSANPMNRFVINSAMLTSLKRDPDGGLTIYIQHDSPGKDKESNWLPAPNGTFFTALRLYWPMPEAFHGQWQHPPLQRLTPDELKKAG